MREVEEMLNEKKNDVDQIKVPEELEERLSSALNNHKPIKAKRKYLKVRIAVVFIAVLLIGYNIDTLAFYGKQLIGYDQVMNGTLKELNELGKGQMIDKSHTFESGVIITLDGIMIDENQLLAFYTIEDPSGNVDDYMPLMEIKGLFKVYHSQSGQGQMNDEKTIMKNLHSFQAPLFFEKTLQLNLSLMKNGTMEDGEIIFKIDRNKAMGHTLKKSINKTVKAERTHIKFESILASPTKTVINGTIQNIFELGIDQILGERMRPNLLEVELLANREKLAHQGGGMSTNMNGITFHEEYDALPEELQSLQILVKSFSTDHDVNYQEKINVETKNQNINIEGQNIEINKVQESDGNTFVTITTGEGTLLTRIYLVVDGERVELEKTTTDNYEKLKEGKILHIRTLKFPARGKEYELDIRRITYPEEYNKIIDISVN